MSPTAQTRNYVPPLPLLPYRQIAQAPFGGIWWRVGRPSSHISLPTERCSSPAGDWGPRSDLPQALEVRPLSPPTSPHTPALESFWPPWVPA